MIWKMIVYCMNIIIHGLNMKVHCLNMIVHGLNMTVHYLNMIVHGLTFLDTSALTQIESLWNQLFKINSKYHNSGTDSELCQINWDIAASQIILRVGRRLIWNMLRLSTTMHQPFLLLFFFGRGEATKAKSNSTKNIDIFFLEKNTCTPAPTLLYY